MPSVRLPFPAASNLVFSADGRHVFLRSAAGDLWSVDVPRDVREPLQAPRREFKASAGAVVAVGWLEGRLATLVVEDDTLLASHGAFDVDSGVSSALRIAFPGSGLTLGAHSRLDPYLQWLGEINPVEELPDAHTLVRGDDDRLFSVIPPRRGDRARLALVAEDVTSVALLDRECRSVAFAGRLPPRPHSLWERIAHGGPMRSSGVFELSRRSVWRPILIRAVAGPLPRAIFTHAGSSGLSPVAVETSCLLWTVVSEEYELSIPVPPEHEVVGVLGLRTGPGPVLVLVDLNAANVILVDGQGKRQTAVSIGRPIDRVACSIAEPVIAYVTDGHLHVGALVQ